MSTEDRGQRGGIEEPLISHSTQPAPNQLSHEQKLTALQPKDEGEASQLQESEAVGSREVTHDLWAAALAAHPGSWRDPVPSPIEPVGSGEDTHDLWAAALAVHPDSWRDPVPLPIEAVCSREDTHDVWAAALAAHPESRRDPVPFPRKMVLIDEGWPLKKFSHGELVLATTNFSDDKKIGEGEFGSVYQGYLSDLNLMVAVKKIERVSRECKQVYVQEMANIRIFPHENLVQLIGWSYNPGEFLLVSEFMPNGSLDTHLFGKKRTLTWPIRYKTALGLASALLYLHEEILWATPPVAGRDIKSSNVMFDSSFTAKLGEFGLNGLIERDRGLGPQTTMLPLNLGYFAPEYICSRRASKESDVYSFGVVALEIAAGQKAANPTVEDSRMGLVERIWNLYENGRLLKAADERLHMDFDEKEMECLMIVGLWCAHPDYNLRPSIRQAIAVLHFDAEMPNLPNRMPVAMYMGSSSSAPSSQHSVTTSSIPLDG